MRFSATGASASTCAYAKSSTYTKNRSCRPSPSIVRGSPRDRPPEERRGDDVVAHPRSERDAVAQDRVRPSVEGVVVAAHHLGWRPSSSRRGGDRCRVENGVDSSTTSPTVAAYTHTVLARMTRPASARRAASSTLAVPSTLRSTLSRGSAIDVVDVGHGREVEDRPRMSSQRASEAVGVEDVDGPPLDVVALRRPPDRSRARCGRPSRRASTTWEPMKPEPPVTATSFASLIEPALRRATR